MWSVQPNLLSSKMSLPLLPPTACKHPGSTINTSCLPSYLSDWEQTCRCMWTLYTPDVFICIRLLLSYNCSGLVILQCVTIHKVKCLRVQLFTITWNSVNFMEQQCWHLSWTRADYVSSIHYEQIILLLIPCNLWILGVPIPACGVNPLFPECYEVALAS